MAIGVTSTAGAETSRATASAAMTSAATKVTREAEKTLRTVTTWNSAHPALFADDTRRTQLFNVASQARRVNRRLAVLNDQNAVPFFAEYSIFADALSDLHRAVALKADWSLLVEETLVSANKALRALNDSTEEKYSASPELSQFDPTPSVL